MARYGWDEAKRLANLEKHGIDFLGVEAVFEGYTLTIEDKRLGYGEQRFVTFGLLERALVAVVHTERNDTIRIISIRRATRSEKKSYLCTLSD
jgi:uncharacterized protein